MLDGGPMKGLPTQDAEAASCAEVAGEWERRARSGEPDFAGALRRQWGALLDGEERPPLWLRRLQAELWLREGLREEARQSLNALMKEPGLDAATRCWLELNFFELEDEGAGTDPQGRLPRAAEWAREAARDDLLAFVRLTEGRAAYERGDFARALEASGAAAGLLEAWGLTGPLAGVWGNLGLTQQALGHTAEALRAYQRSADLAASINDALGRARNDYNLGCLYRQMGDFEGAAEKLGAAMEGLRALGHARGMALVGNAIGVQQSAQGRWEEAIATHRSVAEWKREAGLKGDLASSHINLGESLFGAGRPEEAEAAFKAALEAIDRHGPERNRAHATIGLARVAWARGAFAAARAHLSLALGQALAAGGESCVADALFQGIEWAASSEGSGDAGFPAWLAAFARAAGLAGEEPLAALLSHARDLAERHGAEDRRIRLLALEAGRLRRAGEAARAFDLLQEAREAERRMHSSASDRLREALALRYDLERNQAAASAARREADLLRAALDRVVASHTDRQMLLDVLAHDLRNGLGAIRASSQLLSRPDMASLPAAEGRALLGEIDRTASALLRILHDLLAGGDGVLTPDGKRSPVEWATLLQNVADLRQAMAAERRVAVSIAVEEPPPPPPAQPAWLREVADNLLANALRHSPEGGVVWVRLRQTRKETRKEVVLEVDDEGPGIAPEVAPYLFTRFGGGGTGDSTGLGLSIVKRLADRLGGSVEHAPSARGGALFRVCLPLSSGDEVDAR